MIEKLGYFEANIFDVELSADKKSLTLTEACDLYYSIDLSKEQVAKLITDFQKLHDQMMSL